MILLALECSAPRRSVAVARDGRVLAQKSHAAGRGTPLLALVEEALGIAGLPRQEVEALAVGLGPGSYTGIRSAIALAQGWGAARAVRLQGVSSAEACALHARRHGLQGPIAVIIDAQRGEFYLAGFDLPAGAGPIASGPLRLVSREEVEGLGATGVRLVGPELAAAGLAGEEIMPDAAAIAELAATRQDLSEGGRLEPIYLRAASFVKAPPPRGAS
jgi:tRNA threonylcarbamoyl adenosine modification protein YeaZ